ncbi:MAG: LptF/LptG family permease [Planctomycetes bacterium]|nr:LptF/LptG family permease [Planctomycetota bacterium]
MYNQNSVLYYYKRLYSIDRVCCLLFKILQKYVIKELFRTFFPAFLCFELLMLLGFSIQLLHKGLGVPSLTHILPYLALYAFPYALPTSLLTATVMTYGKLSANNEITSIRTAGVHLYKIIFPIIFMGILFSLITLYLNSEVLPKSYFHVRKFQEKAVKQVLAKHFVSAKKKINVYPYQVIVSNVEHGIYKNIAVFEYSGDFIVNIILAEEGEIFISSEENLAVLTLRRGEFIKPVGEGKASVPKMGSFEEATFDIPFKQRVRNTSLKYTTLTDILAKKNEISDSLKDIEVFFQDPEKTIDDTSSEIATVTDKKKEIARNLETARFEIEIAVKNISKQDTILKRTNIDIKNFENYKRIAQNNLKKIKKEQMISSIEDKKVLEQDSLELKSAAELKNKASLIKKTISRGNRRIKSAKRKLVIAKRVRNKEIERRDESSKIIEELNPVKEELDKEYTTLSRKIDSANKQLLNRELSLNIHKRLAPSFSCIAFVLIGIPIGIMTKSNNLLISLGISFILILLLYYPLVALGQILAEDSIYPIIPSFWGANVFNFILSIVLFTKILRK